MNKYKKFRAFLIVFILFFGNLKSEVIEMRNTELIYDENSNLYCIKIIITSFINDREDFIYILSSDNKKNIVLKRNGSNKLYKAFEKIEEIENISIEEKERIEEIAYNSIIKEINQVLEINDNEKKEEIKIFEGENNNICLLDKENKKMCNTEALNFISKTFSKEISCLLGVWRSYWGNENMGCFKRKIENTFISCDEAEGKIGFQCEKWKNVKAVKGTQRIER